MSIVGHDDGIFNIEGGCYAKCINLNAEKEPDIFKAIRFGALFENVIMDELTREVDFKRRIYYRKHTFVLSY